MKGGEDVSDLDALYRAHFKDVFLYLYRLSGSEQLAQELSSDVFYRAFRALDSFRGKCDVRVWLLRIAKNCYYSHIKKAKRIVPTPPDELRSLPDPAPSIEEELIQREQITRIRACLQHLRDPYKEVFMWRVFAELSFREIGNLLDHSENWACVTYHRATKMIRKQLEDLP